MTVVWPPDGIDPPMPQWLLDAEITESGRKKRAPYQSARNCGTPMARLRRYHCRMEPPGITRHRRPFLAPLWLTLLAAVAVGAIAWAVHSSATTTVVFLVPAAQKEPGTIEDPPVSPEGEARAQRLAHVFGETAGSGGLDAIYVSSERRAQQTAAPLVERLQRSPVVFDASDARSTAAQALHAQGGGTVLVVASGAALAQMLAELTGMQQPLPALDPDLIYVVSIPSIGRAHLARLRL